MHPSPEPAARQGQRDPLVKRGGRGLLSRFVRDRRGAFATQFALMITPLIICTGLAIDGGRVFLARFELAHALDAAALAVGSIYDDSVDEEQVAQTFVDKNFRSAGTGPVSIELTREDEDIRLTGQVEVNTFFMPIIGMPTVEVGAASEVRRGGANVEVALVLDVTGSMAGGRLAALKVAAKDLIDIVVADDQSIWYSRVGIVPYSNSVYTGSRSVAARGAIPDANSITAAVWKDGPLLTIADVEHTNNPRFEIANHGLSNDDHVYVSGIPNFTSGVYEVKNVNGADRFRLETLAGAQLNSAAWGALSAASQVQKCLKPRCELEIEAPGHDIEEGEWSHIRDVQGLTRAPSISLVNDKSWRAIDVDANSFTLEGSDPWRYNDYQSAGDVWCAKYGCEYFRFVSRWGAGLTYRASECAVERTGAQRYTDASAGTAPVTILYVPTNSPGTCNSTGVVRMFSDVKATLRNNIDALTATGSTAGHIGLAWGWYMLSPNWETVFAGGANAAGPYDDDDFVKVAVMMTDGEFNTAYCQGVVDSTINCNAVNGGPYPQFASLCAGMKAQGILIYTVGLGINAGSTAANALRNCASGAGYAYLASTGSELTSAFRAIARSIALLRLSK